MSFGRKSNLLFQSWSGQRVASIMRRTGGGSKPMPSRQIFSAIVYVLRTGCQWKALPRDLGSSSSVHAHFQSWQRTGFSFVCGGQGWSNTTKWKASRGDGRASFCGTLMK
jgi:transposase